MPIRFPAVAVYGVKAMVDLALHEGQGPISTVAIAKRHTIPAECLEQVLHRLRRAGLVVAERGARGGYQLSRPPAQISVADIVQVFDRAPRRTADPASARSRDSGAVDHATRLVWARIEAAIGATLTTTTLAELATEARRRHTNHTVNHTYTFHI